MRYFNFFPIFFLSLLCCSTIGHSQVSKPKTVKPLIKYTKGSHSASGFTITTERDYTWNGVYSEIPKIDAEYYTGSNMQNLHHHTRTYTNGKVTEEIHQATNLVNGIVENSRKSNYTYDATCEKKTHEDVKRWWNDAWIDYFEYDYTYNDSCLLTERSYKEYGVDGSVINEYRYTYYYNTFNKLDSLFIEDKDNNGNWSVLSKFYYTYTETEKRLSLIGHQTNGATNILEPSYQYIYTYNNDDNLIIRTLYDADYSTGGLLWVYDIKWEYEYKNDVVVEERKYDWYPSMIDWSPIEQTLTEYDLENDPVQDSTYLWDGSSFSILDTRSNWYYAFLTSTESILEETLLCNLPNPYTLGTPIICEDFKNNKDYTIQVYNTLGQVMESQAINGATQQFSINNPMISTGMYFVSIISEGQLLKTQKVLINR